MKPRFVPTVLSGALIVAACGGGGGDGVGRFTDACVTSMNLERPICECAGKKAEEELSPKGLEFLTATLAKDAERAAALRSELSVAEATGAGTFLVSGPARCAKEAAGD